VWNLIKDFRQRARVKFPGRGGEEAPTRLEMVKVVRWLGVNT